ALAHCSSSDRAVPESPDCSVHRKRRKRRASVCQSTYISSHRARLGCEHNQASSTALPWTWRRSANLSSTVDNSLPWWHRKNVPAFRDRRETGSSTVVIPTTSSRHF